jgi:hypothetical protein
VVFAIIMSFLIELKCLTANQHEQGKYVAPVVLGGLPVRD